MVCYSVLKYKNSYSLDEVLNVGILFYSYELNKIDFIFPDSLRRLKQCFSTVDIHILRRYLLSFKSKARQLKNLWAGSIQEFNESDFQGIIKDYFLTEESTSLYFSKIYCANSISFEKTIEYFNSLFFRDYESTKYNKHDEKFILDKIKREIKSILPDCEPNFQKDIVIKNNNRGIIEKFDLAWKNGYLNLVTPISFDLTDNQYIKEKALKWFGTLTFLKEVSNIDDYKFDIFISKPKEKNLFHSFDQAIKIIEVIDVNKNIFEEEQIPEYLLKAKSNLKSIC